MDFSSGKELFITITNLYSDYGWGGGAVRPSQTLIAVVTFFLSYNYGKQLSDEFTAKNS